ncbi:hypothetical protein EBU95_02145 [bacterium]|nr:hypothetical protein [bacterium]
MNMDFIKKFDNQVNEIFEGIVKKPEYVRGALHLLLILYAAKIAPVLPNHILSLFDNAYFKLFVFSLILWTAQFSPSTAILISLSFMISVNLLNNKKAWEFMENTTPEPVVRPVMQPIVQPVMQPVVEAPISKSDDTPCYPVRKVDMAGVAPA